MSAARNLQQEFSKMYVGDHSTSSAPVYASPSKYTSAQNRQAVASNLYKNASSKPPTPQRCEIEIPGRFRIQIQAVGKKIHVKHSEPGVTSLRIRGQGLPAFKPVIYANPEEESGEDDYPRGGYASPTRAYVSPPGSPYEKSTTYHPVHKTAPLPSASPEHRYGSVSPPSRSDTAYFSDEEYVPAPVPSQASYRSIVSPTSPQSMYSQLRAGERMATASYEHVPRSSYPARDYVPGQQTPQAQVPTSTSVQSQGERYPEGVRSQLMYTKPAHPVHNFVQSHPTSPTAAPTSQALSTAQRYDSPPGSPRPQYASGSSQGSFTSPVKVIHQQRETGQTTPRSGSQSPRGSEPTTPVAKEAEVDALTSLLVQNLKAAADPDFFGVCVHCGRNVKGQYNACRFLEKIYHIQCFTCVMCGMCDKCGTPILGENTGCSALSQTYHVECFVCLACGICLGGQPFFAMEGKPHCETCYLNTLEKCSVCSHPITERILRATGKPYHPGCFTCVVCGKSLDGVPFTVDATNQIHCIEDFHKKFAPRCCVCNFPIMPEPGKEETVRIVALDRSFHTKCYMCEDCGTQLSSEAEGKGCYPLDDSILCKACNAKRIQAMTTKMTTEL